LYGARDEKHNDAVALKELLDLKLGMRLKHWLTQDVRNYGRVAINSWTHVSVTILG
jgi:hypothetical protein